MKVMRHSRHDALDVIQQCLAEERFRMTLHFRQRMSERGLIWPDVLAVVDDPADIRWGKRDAHGREKWIICGAAGDGLGVEMVCVLDVDERGQVTVLVTIYTV